MIGLKENVIIGKLIPAGTGMKRYSQVKLDTDAQLAAQAAAEAELKSLEELDLDVEEEVEEILEQDQDDTVIVQE